MSNECPHIWMLDDEKYFTDDNACFEWRPMEYADCIDIKVIVFPAKCHMCEEQKSFTKEEWLEHKREQGFLK